MFYQNLPIELTRLNGKMRFVLVMILALLLIGCEAEKDSLNPSEIKTMFGKKEKKTYVISSPMEGVLMKGGTPLPNTKIIRTLFWNGIDEDKQKLVQEFVTDDEGRFSLPIHEDRMALGMLTQFVSTTALEAEIDGQKVLLWYHGKLEENVYAETNGPISNLVCDISNEEIRVRPDITTITTVCRWAEMPAEESLDDY